MIGVTCCSPAHIGLSRIGRNSLTKLCSSLLGGSSLSFCSLTDDTQCAGHHGVGKKCAKYISCVARTQCLVFQYQKGTWWFMNNFGINQRLFSMIIFLLRLNLSRYVPCVLSIGLGVMVDGGGVTVDAHYYPHCETEHSGWKIQLYKTVLSTPL